ncbi:hypothetical protein FDI69_gp167 [Rhodococcus phage Trina]|uniref:Uncharacterized protein n=1 Tax=Rhodococcus phage Trina TaxID=2027905 RepID=A0A2D0ZN60_9CAUD|nr:hypothetical protein FDI69_gp167 [Rhodococcus phage Trina]ASZ75019.1 hypothetical protein SEA_TRINA_240 [Rhodococcus phage Trina]
MVNRANELTDIVQAIALHSFEAGSLRATAILRGEPEPEKVKQLHKLVSQLSLAMLSYYNEQYAEDTQLGIDYLSGKGIFSTAEQAQKRYGKPLSAS